MVGSSSEAGRSGNVGAWFVPGVRGVTFDFTSPLTFRLQISSFSFKWNRIPELKMLNLKRWNSIFEAILGWSLLSCVNLSLFVWFPAQLMSSQQAFETQWGGWSKVKSAHCGAQVTYQVLKMFLVEVWMLSASRTFWWTSLFSDYCIRARRPPQLDRPKSSHCVFFGEYLRALSLAV